MTKYSVINSLLNVLASANTLHMAKRAFYDEVKMNPDAKLMLVDANLETYAIFRDGKVVAGRKWQAFVKSSYNAPKPKVTTPAEMVTPAPVVKSYVELQADWLAANDLKVGDEVKIVAKIDDYKDGWQNSWYDFGMNPTIGKTGKISLISSNGIHLTVKRDRYGYHFESLEVVPTIKRVCKDVIAQINAELLQCHTGVTINIRHDAYHDMTERERENTSAKEFLADKKCIVCGVGGVAISWIRRFNKFSVVQAARMATDTTESLPPELVELFGEKLLAEIEVAFEKKTHEWNYERVASARRIELIDRYRHIFDPNERLITIMQDIIDDKF